jgi:hypothetical protein
MSEFNSPTEFYAALGRDGERTEIAAVCSPMIYTDIEDKIEQLRVRLNAVEGCFERVFALEFQVATLQKDVEKWRRKAKAKRPKSLRS